MRRVLASLVLVAAASICGCSGGGSSSVSAPAPVYTGAGSSAAVNQKITFTIIVPATSATSSDLRRGASTRRHVAAASPVPTTPYISPATGSIVLSLAEINGISPQVVPPVIPPIPVTCQGCTFTAPNIPAATGTDRYFVQTYSGYANGKATGNLISTGFVDVTVPVTSSPSLGGAAALSIGGYVNQITFAPQILTFNKGTAGDQNLFVHALDAGGATIIGAVQYANPIAISLGNTTYFSLDGALSESLDQPQQKPIDVHYNGGVTFGTTVSATSQNGSGVNVSATPGILNVVSPTTMPGQTPAPSPSPTLPPPKTSLYVADALTDTVSEYGFVTQLEAGHVPNPIPSPQRSMTFNLAAVQAGPDPLLSCNASIFIPNSNSLNSAGTVGLAVTKDGTIFTLPTCYDQTNTYVFGFPANSSGLTTPTIYDPVAGSTIGLSTGNSAGMTYDPVKDIIYAGFVGNTYAIAGFSSKSNNQQPSYLTGSYCYQEFQQPPCSIFIPVGGAFSTGFGGGFGIDDQGNAYVPAYWADPAPAPTTVPTPSGNASLFNEPPAILVAALSSSSSPSSPTTPETVIGGLDAELGANNSSPLSAIVDGTTLYVLVPGGQLSTSDGNTNYYPGLSSCPNSSPNAPVNTTFTYPVLGGPAVPASNCADGFLHDYLVAYSLDSSILGPLYNGTVVDPTPLFVLGGDVVGRFGCNNPYAGQYLAASAGYVYIINTSGPTCTPSSPTNNYAPEIDVYDTRNLSNAHTDIAPVAVISLNSGAPSALAIGPSAPAGTPTGGQAASRRPAAKRSHFASGFPKFLHHRAGWRAGKLVPYPGDSR